MWTRQQPCRGLAVSEVHVAEMSAGRIECGREVLGQGAGKAGGHLWAGELPLSGAALLPSADAGLCACLGPRDVSIAGQQGGRAS